MPNILVIEDDVVIARALESELHESGFEVKVMLEGEAGVDFINAFHPDLVLLDLGLPQHSGLEVLHEMRNDEKLRNVPVIILSNFSGEEMKKTVSGLGVSAYLVKSETALSDVTVKVNEVLA